MKLDRAQLDAVMEVYNVAIGRAVTTLADPLNLHFSRRDALSDTFDLSVLGITLAQHVGNSGDVAMCTLSGHLAGVAAAVFKKTSGFKLVNLHDRKPIDDLPASPDKAFDALRTHADGALQAIASSLSAQTHIEIDREPARLVRCNQSIEALLESFPQTIARRTREIAVSLHTISTDDAAIQGAILIAADPAGFTAFLRSSRLAA